MKLLMSLVIIVFTFKTFSAPRSEDVLEELFYNNYKSSILSGEVVSQKGFTAMEQKLFVDALWDLVELEESPDALKALEELNPFYYELIERLRVGILRIKYKRAQSLSEDLRQDLFNTLLLPEVDIRIIYTIAAYEKELLDAGHGELIALAKMHDSYFDISDDESRAKEITDDVIADLFYNSPDVTSYMNGEYLRSVKIFMFCREIRLFPCLMTMRNVHGEIVRNEDGSIWTHPALASSARGLPSYTRNGNTPAGVWTIDSVMPYADQQLSFGKFRRMMMHFIPKATNEVHLKALLPSSSHNLDWWKPSVVARNAGRNLFRIHGTGKINKDPSTPYHPFMRTAGCIAQRENTYGNVTYKDQRILLDRVMMAMDLEPNFANEINVKGILYVMDIDNENAPVTAEDLAKKGIE